MNVEFEQAYLAELYEKGNPYHPGELIKEELACRGIRQKDFAQKFGLPYSSLNETLNAIKKIAAVF